MQLNDTFNSVTAIKHLALAGACMFDLSLDEPRLRPVLFGSYSNMTYEGNYHSFIGEVACGR